MFQHFHQNITYPMHNLQTLNQTHRNELEVAPSFRRLLFFTLLFSLIGYVSRHFDRCHRRLALLITYSWWIGWNSMAVGLFCISIAGSTGNERWTQDTVSKVEPARVCNRWQHCTVDAGVVHAARIATNRNCVGCWRDAPISGIME